MSINSYYYCDLNVSFLDVMMTGINDGKENAIFEKKEIQWNILHFMIENEDLKRKKKKKIHTQSRRESTQRLSFVWFGLTTINVKCIIDYYSISVSLCL